MEFYAPDGGEIWFNGERIDGVTPDRVAANFDALLASIAQA